MPATLNHSSKAVSDLINREDYLALQAQLRLANFRIKQLEAVLYGRSSEKLPPEDPAQLKLLKQLDEELKPAAPAATEDLLEDADEPVEEKKARRRTRHPLPENVETVTTTIDVPAEEKVCAHCGKDKARIGHETSEELEIIPARFIKKQVLRPKYACPCGEAGVVIAPLPPRLIEKGRCGPGLLAHMILAKYLDHLPLYRQEQIFRERYGVYISRQTMSGWVEKVAEYMEAIRRVMKEEMLVKGYLQVDETPVKVQDPDVTGKTATGYLWVYADPGGDVLFEFHKSRGLAPPLEFLKEFKGYIQTDGYQVYESLGTRRPDLRRIGCMAHARRKFHEALQDDQAQALWFIKQISLLYRIERKAREEALTHEQRKELREAHAPEILKTIKNQLDALRDKYPDKTPMAKAIHYALNQWEALRGYLQDGRLEMDNNLIENSIRPTAVGKKNWLFLGHPEAGWRSAAIYSVLVSCRRRGINPAEYLADIFARLPGMKSNELKEITPANWKKKSVET